MRIVLVPQYDDPYSIFPTRLICAEGNPDINATVSIVSPILDAAQIEVRFPRLQLIDNENLMINISLKSEWDRTIDNTSSRTLFASFPMRPHVA